MEAFQASGGCVSSMEAFPRCVSSMEDIAALHVAVQNGPLKDVALCDAGRASQVDLMRWGATSGAAEQRIQH